MPIVNIQDAREVERSLHWPRYPLLAPTLRFKPAPPP